MIKTMCNCCGKSDVPLVYSNCRFRGVNKVIENGPFTMEYKIHLCKECLFKFINEEVIAERLQNYQEIMNRREVKVKKLNEID